MPKDPTTETVKILRARMAVHIESGEWHQADALWQAMLAIRQVVKQGADDGGMASIAYLR